jgi:hypothetical protein
MVTKFKKASELKAEQGLKFLLHSALAIVDPPRSLDILHASELTREDMEFCPRERALLLRDGDNRKEGRLGTSLNVTYQVGRWYEEQVRNVWLRKYALGNWQCTSCEHTHEYQTVPETCDNCDIHGDMCQYIEPRAYSPEFDTSCGIDFLLWKDGLLTPVEVKTIKAEDFKVLHAPMSEHRKRTAFYLDLLSHSTWMDFDVKINLDYGILLYCCKGFGFADDMEGRQGVPDAKFSPFKEFKVKRAEGKTLTTVYQKALDVKAYKSTGKVPKRICPNLTCTRAKWCTVKKTCFGEAG